LDNVERVLSDIRQDAEIMRTRFTGLVDDVANILEKHGFGVAKAFLLEKEGHRELQYQAKALLRVLEKVETYPDVSADRATARLIIKAVSMLKLARGGQE